MASQHKPPFFLCGEGLCLNSSLPLGCFQRKEVAVPHLFQKFSLQKEKKTEEQTAKMGKYFTKHFYGLL